MAHTQGLNCTAFIVALFLGTTSCGETTHGADEVSAPVGGAGGGGAVGSAGTAEPTYAGVVLAMVTERNATLEYVARAVFASGPRPVIAGEPECRCGGGRGGLPIPEKPPDAGDITLISDSTGLARLVPEVFDDGTGTFHGTSDLGWSWFGPLSDYAPVTSQPWTMNATLDVAATGNEIAPFSGRLRVGRAFVGVTPPIGLAPLVIDHSKPFQIGWMPSGDGDARVMLGIPSASGVCYCDVPDSAGSLVVAPELLSPISGELSLTRFTVSTIANNNASIDLVGAVVLRGAVEVD